MQDVVKKVLGLISTRGIQSKDIYLGDLITEILFKNQAVLIDETRQVYLLERKNRESER